MSRNTAVLFLLIVGLLVVVARYQQERVEIPSHPTEIVGEVRYVVDGDTVILLRKDGSDLTIRLEGIDAPEMGQAFGDQSKRWLADVTSDVPVRVVASGTDRYGRTLGDLYIGDRWLNRELVASGLAWHYARYRQSSQLAGAQKAAQTAKLGLWQDANRTAPWDYRDSQQ